MTMIKSQVIDREEQKR